jgi:hypothetical protein
MTLSRASTVTYLAAEFAALLTESGVGATDITAGLGPPVDNALRQMEVAEADLATTTVADADVSAYLALCEYYALARICRALANRGDIDARNTIGPRSIVFQQARDLMQQAEAKCAAFGYAVTGGGSFEFGRLVLDYTEPITALLDSA